MAENIQETANETKSKKQIYDEQKAERLAKREKELKLQVHLKAFLVVHFLALCYT